PARLRKVIERTAPARAGVVDEHIEALFALPHLGGQTIDLLHLRQIGWKGYALTQYRKLLRQLAAHLRITSGNVDFGTVLHVGARHHLAEAAPAAGDEDNLSSNRKQVFDLHGVSSRIILQHAIVRHRIADVSVKTSSRSIEAVP